MQNKKHAKEWLEKARHNLKAAEILCKANHYTDVIGIELHQAIEKTLKALPAFSNRKIERIHDLGILLNEAKELINIDQNYYNLCDIATDYYSTERYPSFMNDLPPTHEIEKILEMAIDLFNKVKEHIEK